MVERPIHSESSSSSLWMDAGWRAVIAAFALNGLLFGAWAARIPAFRDRFDLDPAMLGVLLLALAGGAIVSFPLAGSLSERWSAQRLTLRCAWGYAPALVLLAFAPNPLLLGAALFIFGALHGAMDVAMNGWGAQVETRLGRSTMSVFHALFSLGAGLGALSGYFAVRLGLGPASHFALVALSGGIIALRFMIAAQTAQPVRGDGGDERPVVALPSGALLLVGLVAFCASIGEGAMADWSAVFLRTVASASEAQSALGYAAFSATMVATRLCGDALVQRVGAVMATRLSGSTACLGLIMATVSDTVPPVLIGFSLVGIGYAIIMPLVFTRAANDPWTRPGPAIASVATLGYGGMLLGPPVVGFIAQISGLRTSFAVLAALALLAALLAPALRVERSA